MTPLSVFITGATGALGREVTRQLTRRRTSRHRGDQRLRERRACPRRWRHPGVPRSDARGRNAQHHAGGEDRCGDQPRAAACQSSAAAARQLGCDAGGRRRRARCSKRRRLPGSSSSSTPATPSPTKSRKRWTICWRPSERASRKSSRRSVPGCVLRMGFVYGAESPELVATRDTLLMGRMIDCGPGRQPCLLDQRAGCRARGDLAAMQARPPERCSTSSRISRSPRRSFCVISPRARASAAPDARRASRPGRSRRKSRSR